MDTRKGVWERGREMEVASRRAEHEAEHDRGRRVALTLAKNLDRAKTASLVGLSKPK